MKKRFVTTLLSLSLAMTMATPAFAAELITPAGDSSKDVKCAEDAGVKPLRIHKNQDITPVIDQILKSKDSF